MKKAGIESAFRMSFSHNISNTVRHGCQGREAYTLPLTTVAGLCTVKSEKRREEDFLLFG